LEVKILRGRWRFRQIFVLIFMCVTCCRLACSRHLWLVWDGIRLSEWLWMFLRLNVVAEFCEVVVGPSMF